MRNLFVAIAISAFALTAQAKEEQKQPSILDVDCNAVIGKAGAKKRCLEKQKAERYRLGLPEPVEDKGTAGKNTSNSPSKGSRTYSSSASSNMNLYKAKAIISATHELLKNCRIKLDVYWGRSPEKVNPCLKDMANALGDNGDYQKAVNWFTSLGAEGMEREMSLSEAKMVVWEMKQVVEDKEYIVYRLANQ